MDDTERDVLNLDGAARFLGVSGNTVRKLIRDGELPCARYANRIFLRRQDLDQFVEDHLEVA